ASTVAVDVTGILAASLIAGLGLFILPRKRRQSRAEFRRRSDELEQRLVAVMSEQFEHELARSVRRIADAIAPSTRFVRDHPDTPPIPPPIPPPPASPPVPPATAAAPPRLPPPPPCPRPPTPPSSRRPWKHPNPSLPPRPDQHPSRTATAPPKRIDRATSNRR